METKDINPDDEEKVTLACSMSFMSWDKLADVLGQVTHQDAIALREQILTEVLGLQDAAARQHKADIGRMSKWTNDRAEQMRADDDEELLEILNARAPDINLANYPEDVREAYQALLLPIGHDLRTITLAYNQLCHVHRNHTNALCELDVAYETLLAHFTDDE